MNEYYLQLLSAAKADNNFLEPAYRQLRELLEQICRSQMPDSSLQMTDLAARINFVGAKIGLSTREQNRLHTFRLTSNNILNRREEPTREHLLRDVKTLAFFTKKLTDQEIPDELYELLPKADATYLVAPPSKEFVRRMRVCFEDADEHFLYVQPLDRLADEPLKVRYGLPEINAEFNDTCKILWRNAQLNLLDVSVDDAGILTPRFIILEPDYLIDISSLAECFKEYGHHPLNYVLARLQLSENTIPLLLGNIANLFLDEWIHAEEAPDYRASMKKAFRQYTLELAACNDLRDKMKERGFFDNCAMHFENIRRTVKETFSMSGYDLEKDDAVLEPSYICEALGLQGRLDYMQRDMTSFIEMKSGKADEYKIPGKIEPKENNRVQMLLYQAVLEFSMGMDHRSVHSYLLYTRYPLLYPARPSWAMLRRVMDVRNRIVANEYGIQLRNSPYYTFDRLQEITPDNLNERDLKTTFWKRFLSPSIQRFSDHLNTLSSLEKKYFCTLYNFITKELYTSKSGDLDYEGHAGASSLWLSTLDEKCEAGEILFDLQIVANRADDEHKPILTLRRMHEVEELEALPNFRVGDAVVLYQRNKGTDNVTNQLVFKGNIEKIADTEITVRLRAAQRNTKVLPMNVRYAVEHDYMDTSFRSMYTGLSAFLYATEDRRNLLLGQRKPLYDASFRQAIQAADNDFKRITLKAQAAQDYFLLVGPPGTGKTSRALRSMVEAFNNEGKQILLMAYTNRAVDEICKSLVSIQPSVSFIRMGSELSCDEPYRPYLLENALENCANRTHVQQRIAQCRIFVGTIATLSLKTELFKLKTFDAAIIDEASQILEPQLLGLLCSRNPAGGNAIGKFIMIGDHKQLPAVVMQAAEQSEVREEELREIGLLNVRNSLFERLYHQCRLHPETSDNLVDMLCKQGRMNSVIAEFPNQAFYEGRLDCVGLPHQSGELPSLPAGFSGDYAALVNQRVAFIPSVAEPLLKSVKMNHSEARIVARLSASVYQYYQAQEGFSPAVTLGIIAPYRSQIALIKRELSALQIPALNEVLVDTVERFQGSERDVIIYSFCASHIRQLKFLSNITDDEGIMVDRKLNVALTRARKQMFLTGVPAILKQNYIYKRLLESLEA